MSEIYRREEQTQKSKCLNEAADLTIWKELFICYLECILVELNRNRHFFLVDIVCLNPHLLQWEGTLNELIILSFYFNFFKYNFPEKNSFKSCKKKKTFRLELIRVQALTLFKNWMTCDALSTSLSISVRLKQYLNIRTYTSTSLLIYKKSCEYSLSFPRFWDLLRDLFYCVANCMSKSGFTTLQYSQGVLWRLWIF